MDVSIIIVNYNTRELTLNCINSIKQHVKGVEYEIIVVDNGSRDYSREAIVKSFPDVVFINANTNLGFGKANNLGAANAKGNYLFFLNSDTLLINDAVSIFYEYASQNSYHGALGAILEDINENTIHSYGYFATLKSELIDCLSKYFRFLKRKELLNPPRLEAPKSVDYITGADLFIPNETFSQMCGFDPDYFMYSEECDLQYRMNLHNLSRMVLPGPRIIHLEGGSDVSKTKHWSFNRFYNMTQGKLKYVRKNLKPFEVFIFKIIDFVFLTPIILVSNYKWKEKAKIIKLLIVS